jgi:hypothetical protein
MAKSGETGERGTTSALSTRPALSYSLQTKHNRTWHIYTMLSTAPAALVKSELLFIFALILHLYSLAKF